MVVVPTMMTVTLVPQQGSLAVGELNDQVEPHWTTLLVPQVRVGGVVFCTVTVWLQVLLWPEASVTLHVRVANFGQAPLVTVLRMLIWTLVQPPVVVGLSKVQAVVQATVLLVAQMARHGLQFVACQETKTDVPLGHDGVDGSQPLAK